MNADGSRQRRSWLRSGVLASLLALLSPAVGLTQTSHHTAVGDLTIEGSVKTAAAVNFNAGIVKQSTASYRVLHRGKPVSLRDARGGEVELIFWEAWTLPDAPRPAILAANRATYLITQDGAEARVQELRGAYHDNASWQWLDAGGRVGERYKVYIRNQIEGTRELRGGTVLALSGNTLLDVKTLRTQPLALAGDLQRLAQANGYSAGDAAPLLFSAAANQIAALGRNQFETFAIGSASNPEFAIVVADVASGTQYAVPFDRNAMRLAEPQADASPTWAAHHFEWRPDAKGKLRLQARKLSPPRPWMGRFRDPPVDPNSTRSTQYVLMPAGERMVAPVVALIEREFSGKRVPLASDEVPGSKVRMEVAGLPISIQTYAAGPGEPSRVHVATDVPVRATPVAGSRYKLEFSYEPERIRATNQQVMKIGELIDRRLAQGELQQYFRTGAP